MHVSAKQQVSHTRTRLWRRALVFVLALIGAVVVTARWIDARGLRFFEDGREVGLALKTLATAFRDGSAEAVGRLHAAGFSVTSLGLLTRQLTHDKDGAKLYRQRSGGGATDRAVAVAEWDAYRKGFTVVEAAGLNVHQLEQWGGSTLVATVRFEVIGTPAGAPHPGIDRGILRMSFDRTPEGLRIASASLVEGDRIIGDR